MRGSTVPGCNTRIVAVFHHASVHNNYIFYSQVNTAASSMRAMRHRNPRSLLGGMVRGFLTRKLFHSHKVQLTVTTIKVIEINVNGLIFTRAFIGCTESIGHAETSYDKGRQRTEAKNGNTSTYYCYHSNNSACTSSYLNTSKVNFHQYTNQKNTFDFLLRNYCVHFSCLWQD